MIALILAAAVTAAAPDPASDVDTLAGVQALYDQSCQERAYGSYDDLCNALKQQLKEAAQADRKAKGQHPAAVAKPAEVAATPVVAPAPAAPAAASAAN